MFDQNAALITLLIFIAPMLLVLVLYSVEWAAEWVAVYFEEHGGV